jgi:preprotein translocase subunit SecE
MADSIKLILAALVVAASIAGFYIYEDAQTLFRVLGLLAGFGIAAAIALTSEQGKSAAAFIRGAIVEVKKVVWPTRKETVNTTILVLVMVTLVGLLLWGFDSILGALVRYFTGQGG